MKIIYMNVNYNKSLKNKKSKILKDFMNKEKLLELDNMSKEESEVFFKKIDDKIDSLSEKELKKLHLNYVLGSKNTIITKNNKKIFDEIACTEVVNSDLRWQNNFITTIKKISKKMMKILNSKITKTIIFSSITIALYYTNLYSCVTCSSGNFSAKVDYAYYVIRMVSAIVCFIFMCIELSQSAIKGDMRNVWVILAKYISLIVAVVSFKKIFFIIDNIFN